MTQLDSAHPATSESVLHQFVHAIARHANSPFREVEIKPHPSILWANSAAPESALEQFRILRTKLLQHAAAPRVILVASPCPEDGKSTTAINLAGMLAFRHRTLLLDCDLRRSSIAANLGLGPQPGLYSALLGGPLADAIVAPRTLPNLAILPAGTPTVHPTELIGLPAWHTLVTHLRTSFDYIICDSPPINALADFPLLEQLVDASLLVVRANHTDRLAMGTAIDSMDPAKFWGVVLNQSEDWFLWKSNPHYGDYDYTTKTQEPQL